MNKTTATHVLYQFSFPSKRGIVLEKQSITHMVDKPTKDSLSINFFIRPSERFSLNDLKSLNKFITNVIDDIEKIEF
jgi:hypothetical protein